MPEENSLPLTLSFDEDDPGFRQLKHVAGSAAVSDRFEFTIRAFHRDPDLDPSSLVGKRVKLELHGEAQAASIAGIVVRGKQVKRVVKGASLYELVIGPRTDWMKLRRDARIFKDCNATDLAIAVTAPLASRIGNVLVFDTAGLPDHEYRVQYEESDWHAFQRLLAEDGVSFVYDHANGSDVVLIPDLTSYSPITVGLPFIPKSSLAPDVPHIREAQLEARPTIGAATIADAWPERPDFDAKMTSSRLIDIDLEDYRFTPGIDDNADNLDFEAKRHLLEKASTSQVVTLVGSAFVQPGARIVIENPPRLELATPLLVLRVESEWTMGTEARAPKRRHRLTCIPADRPFAPTRLPKARVHGLQRAVVTGEGEIDPDTQGRVLCHFHWDRNKVASRRVPVSQGWAGPGYGLFTQPRVGDEVIVAYLDGDPDEPIVVGRVHNAKNLHPVSLPADKTVSAWRTKSSPGGDGYNEIRMDDKAGEERFDIHAQRDFSSVVERDSTSSVGRNLKLDVKGTSDVGLQKETNVSCASPTTITGTEIRISASDLLKMYGTKVEFDAVEREDGVAGKYTLGVGGDWTVRVGGTERHSATAFRVVATEAISLLCGGSMITVSPGAISLSCGGSNIVITPGSITANSPLIDLNP